MKPLNNLKILKSDMVKQGWVISSFYSHINTLITLCL